MVRRRAKGHLDLDCEPSQHETDSVKAGLDNGALPQKQPKLMILEPAVQNGNLEYEPRLWPGSVDTAAQYPSGLPKSTGFTPGGKSASACMEPIVDTRR
ncbi:unnamed protein product [Tetraodon nigroviridis]|uniref:(spotted green pufferfish) hypothetical protein n=1 Tax=Tetraodon nigroviridis TaxID=99883 RepID=Q4SGR3_TETNG|nr:unnamed protein product [Tetraodon nigroviridis]